jgi:hypothetical protein
VRLGFATIPCEPHSGAKYSAEPNNFR